MLLEVRFYPVFILTKFILTYFRTITSKVTHEKTSRAISLIRLHRPHPQNNLQFFLISFRINASSVKGRPCWGPFTWGIYSKFEKKPHQQPRVRIQLVLKLKCGKRNEFFLTFTLNWCLPMKILRVPNFDAGLRVCFVDTTPVNRRVRS